MSDPETAGGLALLNFTSIHCKPCRKEIPELPGVIESSKIVRLLCIYAEPAHEAAPCAKELGVYIHSYVDALGAVRAKFRVKKFPVTIVVNKQRQILGRFEGYTPGNIEAIRKLTKP